MDKYWIWFKLIDISYISKLKLLKKYKNIKEIYYLDSKILKLHFKFNKNDLDSYYSIELRKRVNKIYEYNKKNNISIINILDKDYPQLLRQIYNPPILLYYIGNINILKYRLITIFIGKNIDEYGIKIVKGIVSKLSKTDIKIVSRAEVVDEKIYRYNLKSNVIILSQGINSKTCTKNGIILSEYEYDVKNSKNNILKRNRVLTGIANELVVIQAGLIDGAQYIVNDAIDQGREISVVPGNIFNENNGFTNMLIHEGANVLDNLDKLLVYEQENNMLTANNKISKLYI